MKTCKDLETLLPLYPEDALSAKDKKEVEAHLASCESCRQALADLQRTADLMASVPDSEEPPWFQEKIMARVRAEADKKSFIQKWFYPLSFKIPLQVAATLVIAVLAVYLYRSGDEKVRTVLPQAMDARIETAAEPPAEAPQKRRPAPQSEIDAQAQRKSEAPGKTTAADAIGSAAGALRTDFKGQPECDEKACAGQGVFSYEEETPQVSVSSPDPSAPPVSQRKSLNKAMEQAVTAARSEAPGAFVTLRVSDAHAAADEAQKILKALGATDITLETREDKTRLWATVDASRLDEAAARLSALGTTRRESPPGVAQGTVRLVLDITGQ